MLDSGAEPQPAGSLTVAAAAAAAGVRRRSAPLSSVGRSSVVPRRLEPLALQERRDVAARRHDGDDVPALARLLGELGGERGRLVGRDADGVELVHGREL